MQGGGGEEGHGGLGGEGEALKGELLVEQLEEFLDLGQFGLYWGLELF